MNFSEAVSAEMEGVVTEKIQSIEEEIAEIEAEMKQQAKDAAKGRLEYLALTKTAVGANVPDSQQLSRAQ